MKKFLDMLSRMFSRSTQPIEAAVLKEVTTKTQVYQLLLTCNQKDIDHLDSLVRYYETKYEGVISRGIWLLTLMRNSEIDSKRLAVIELDEDGRIATAMPITLN